MVQFILAMLMLFMGLFSMAPPETFDAFPVAQAIDPDITYPPSLDTNTERLEAVLSLLDTMRLEYNRVGAVAIADWERHEGRFATYRRLYAEKTGPLLIEYRTLKLAVRKESFSDSQWRDKSEDEKDALYDSLYGDKKTLRETPTIATSRLLDELKAVDFLILDGGWDDPFEDWSAGAGEYTESDASNVLNPVAAQQITVVNLTRTSNSSVSKSFGAGHFDTTFSQSTASTHLISSFGDDFDGANPSIFIYGVANTATPDDGTDPWIGVRMQDRSGTNLRFRLDIDDGATPVDENDISINHALDTQYFLSIVRDGSGVVVRTFTESTLDNQVDVMTVSQGDTSFEFMVSGYSRAGSGTQVSNGTINDLDLQQAAVSRRRAIIISRWHE